MFKEDIKGIRSEANDLRSFGVLVGTVIFALGFYFLLIGRSYFAYFVVFGSIMVAFGMVAPRLLKPFYKIWMIFGIVMGWLVTNIILTVFYFVAVTPIALLGKVIGKKFLDTSFKSAEDSYWNKAESGINVERDGKSIEKQY